MYAIRTSAIGLLPLVVGGLVLASCGPPSTFRPARTIPKGGWEITASLHGSLVGYISPDSTDPFFSGTPGVAGRIGVTSWLDLGAAFDGPLSARLEGTLQLLDTKSFALALAPAVGYQPLPPEIFSDDDDEPLFSFTALLPLAVQVDLLDDVSWVVHAGPLHHQIAGQDGDWFPHVATGFDLRLSSGFSLRPSVSYTFQRRGWVGVMEEDPPTASASIGLVFH